MKVKRFFVISILFSLVLVSALSGCKDKEKVDALIFSTHQTVGTLLEESNTMANSALKAGLIDKATYDQVKVNWLRAKSIYVEAGTIGQKIIQSDDFADLNLYFSMMTQVQVIGYDIISWVTDRGGN